MTFGRCLQQLRRRMFPIPDNFAEEIFISRSYLQMIESGHRLPPKHDILNLIASVLGLTDTELSLLYFLAYDGRKGGRRNMCDKCNGCGFVPCASQYSDVMKLNGELVEYPTMRRCDCNTPKQKESAKEEPRKKDKRQWWND